MNVFRAGVLLAALTLLAIAVVSLRADQARCAARMLSLESDWVALRHELWDVQAGVARLRAPTRIHDRVLWLGTDVVPAGTDESFADVTRLAASNR